MIRAATEDGWTLVTHPDHARLAGEFARCWGNELFALPEPAADVIEAVSAHDDGWTTRDANPQITRQGKPSAFGRDLVGSYSAFEEIDLDDYLRVRGEATETLARRNAFAAILVSMHTCNLLSDQMAPGILDAAATAKLNDFLGRQRNRQRELAAAVEQDPRRKPETAEENLLRCFRFLQCLDHLSLLACMDFQETVALRHEHPDRKGHRQTLTAQPLGSRRFAIAPYPFAQPTLEFSIASRHVRGKTFASEQEFQSAFREAPVRHLKVVLSSA